MKLKQKRPLRTHLAIGFLVFSALLLMVLWLFQTVFLESFYKNVKTVQVKSCANAISENFESEELNSMIADIEDQNGMSVAIYSIDSEIITGIYSTGSRPGSQNDISFRTVYDLYHKAVDNGGEHSEITVIQWEERSVLPDRMLFFSPPSESDEASDFTFGEKQSVSDDSGMQKNFTDGFDSDKATPDNGFFGGRFSASEGQSLREPTRDEADKKDNKREPSLERECQEMLSFAKVIQTSSGERLIIVESEITPVASVVETLRIQLVIVTAVIILLSIAVAIFVGKLIAKPISDTNEQAKALAMQNYDVTFEGGRYREITELNATLNFAAQELKKVDTLQKELISNISHDLRTPLTMITGYSEVMRDLPGEMTPENIQIIIDEANRLNSLVTDLLDISRLQSGTAEMKMAPFSLTACIKGIFSRYTKLVENDGLNIIFEHDGEVFIMGDELRMTQVLYNLINNAVNYIGEDKTVIVRQTVEDDKVRIDVIDHGEGIPKEKLDYIWDRYYRVEKDHRRAKIGTGLGLSIVKNILLAHNADFGVASKLGEGSDFYFILPIIPTGDE